MSSWSLPLEILAAALLTCALLALARRSAGLISDDEFSWGRYLGLVITQVGVGASLQFVSAPLFEALIQIALTFLLLLGAASEARGSARRRRLATSQLYFASLGLVIWYGSAHGLLEGVGASSALTFELQQQVTELTLPLSQLCSGWLSPPAWADPASWIAAVVTGLSAHLLSAAALSTFGFAAFAIAYFSDRPLPAPGLELLPFPTSISILLGALVLAGWFSPAGSPLAAGCALGVTALSPFYVAEGVALLHHWLAPLRARAAILVAALSLAVLIPAGTAALTVLGWLSQAFGLGELLPFLALVGTPLQRPRLRGALVVAAGGAAAFALLAGAAEVAARRLSPHLSDAPSMCVKVRASASADGKMVEFKGPEGAFSIDVEETLRDPESPGAACTLQGKRLCTSDEWYIACICTYPTASESGLRFRGNSVLAGLAAREREQGAAAQATSDDKRTVTRDLLVGQSEVTSARLGSAVLVAGANDARADPWEADCRYRAFVTPAVLDSREWQYYAVRCCR